MAICLRDALVIWDSVLWETMFECPAFARSAGVMILRSKPIALELVFVVPITVAPRWSAKMSTINFLARHPDVVNRICGAVMQGRIGRSTVLDCGEGDGTGRLTSC
jgi:hypothetical protein